MPNSKNSKMDGRLFEVLGGSKSLVYLVFFVALSLIPLSMAIAAEKTVIGKEVTASELFAKQNLVAWCIVPFDGKKRGPAARAAMCQKLGLKKIAYDWRKEHVPTFEQEILEYKKKGLEFFAFWGVHDDAFRLFKKHKLHPQIWVMVHNSKKERQQEKIVDAATRLVPIIERTKATGCKLGLYNHGGWAGEPENLVAVCEYLKKHHDAEHVGIVYNQHHAHDRIDEFSQILQLLKPHLHCLNLNGMTRDGDKRGQKILPLGQGEFDVKLTKTIVDSGYAGPIGIIGHTQDDVELRLQDNLDGLDWIVSQLDGRKDVAKPNPRTWSPKALNTQKTIPSFVGGLMAGKAAYRSVPLTVECCVSGLNSNSYNILIASDTKKSAAHWEIFTAPKNGRLTAYLPGLSPDHIRSQAVICDGKQHTVGMVYGKGQIQLFVDGAVVAKQAVKSRNGKTVPGELGIGRLVEGGLGSSGQIEWVRISQSARKSIWEKHSPPPKDVATVLVWKNGDAFVSNSASSASTKQGAELLGKSPAYSPALAAKYVEMSATSGDAERGLIVFASAKSACLGCHRIGKQGGVVGPSLSEIVKQRKPQEIVESILWPNQKVAPEVTAHMVLDDDGIMHSGYIISEDESKIVLRDPTKGTDHRIIIPIDNIDERQKTGSLMPENLTAAMTEEQLLDLISFINQLNKANGIPLAEIESVLEHAQEHLHGPATFPFERDPLQPERRPYWQHHVNRNRLYDFYAKEADYFRGQNKSGQGVPALLMEYPGLDGGTLGHWGNQHEEIWASDAWNHVKLGSIQAGIFRGAGVTVPRGVCVQLGENNELSCCFNPETLAYEAVWKNGFVEFSSVRHGFMHGLKMKGQAISFDAKNSLLDSDSQSFHYNGFYRVDRRVVFSYRIGDKEFLDSPSVNDGQFVREVAPFDKHSLSKQLVSGTRQWPEELKTEISLGGNGPYVVDTIALPKNNPWNVPLFGGGLGFLPDGSALVCTMHGDVWRVSDIRNLSKEAVWTRFASGLHHSLGMVVDGDGIFVLGRDQITRLKDLNGDGEADFYECFSNAFETSPAGHDFICGLEKDSSGNFYIASGNQGVVRISADGEYAEVVATGFRNPDGISLSPDGLITVPCSEGTWTPATMICGFRVSPSSNKSNKSVPYFGYGGPRNGKPPELPMAYLPRGVDNSAGGQQFVNSDKWGPLEHQLVHFSFGTGSHFLLLRDEVEGQLQGAIVPLEGDFLSGVHRGRFSPVDGQLYVAGMQGWGCYTPENGCFQRVRYTGQSVQIPLGFHTYNNGVLLEFSEPIDKSVAEDVSNHFAQSWNYRYSSAYGSPEFSAMHAGMRGHDRVNIVSAHAVNGGRGLFLEIPDLQPVSQLHLRLRTNTNVDHELFVTVNKLDKKSFAKAPGLKLVTNKVVQQHPIIADLELAKRIQPNPHANRKNGGRKIKIDTASNLSFATRSFTVRAGELIELTLSNPDVVPHNWALVKPGTLRAVGELSNRLISDPDAVFRHYIPQSSDVLHYTNVVFPKDEFTIYFNAPKEPGRYPYLCTFPGHWLVMNGQMIVEK